MASEEIIIDGVDVTGCKHYKKGSCGIETLTPCPYNKDCHYKQLQRKEREPKMTKKILDVCCGSRMFYFDKKNPNVLFMDNRELSSILCDGRVLEIKPDVKADFKTIPYKNNTFSLVIFDPPHLKSAGHNSWIAKKYGILPENWQEELRKGFDECMRVLKPNGVLIFKWNETQIKLSEVLKCFSILPVMGTKTNKNNTTFFLVFMKDKN